MLRHRIRRFIGAGYCWVVALGASQGIPIVASATSGSAGAELRAQPVEDNAPGIKLRTFAPLPGSPRAGLTYVFIETQCGACSPHVHVVGQFGDSYAIYRSSVPTGTVVAVNGGFFGYGQDGRQIALGLVVEDGANRNHSIGWQRGGYLVASSSGKTRIDPARDYARLPSDFNVLQSKPLLVESGRNGIRTDDGERFNRTAVALSGTGKLVIAGAFDSFGRAATLREFSDFLLSMKCSDGSALRWALSMDGGPGAQIYLPSINKHFGDPGRNYVPNLVAVR